MESPEAAEIVKGIGDAIAAFERIEEQLAYLYCQLGELGLAVRNWDEVRQLSDRREQPLQRLIYQKIQGVKKAPQRLSTQNHSDGNAITARYRGSMEPGGDLRLRVTLGDKPHQIQG